MYYLFNGDNNSALIDIPASITDVKVRVTFGKHDENSSSGMLPFGMNLLDNNGNYGIKGATPPVYPPDSGNKSFWDWLKGLFTFKGINYFDKFTNIIQVGAVVLLTAFLLLGLFKLLGFIGMFFRKK